MSERARGLLVVVVLLLVAGCTGPSDPGTVSESAPPTPTVTEQNPADTTQSTASNDSRDVTRTTRTPTPTDPPAATLTPGPDENVSPTIATRREPTDDEVTIDVDWGDAHGLGVAFGGSYRWTVLREADGNTFVLGNISDGDRIHVTAFYPDGNEESLGWIDL